VDPQNYAARTSYRPPASWYRRFNGIGVPIIALGLAPRDAVILEVRGRKSGKLRRLPILRTRHEGDDYLVALAGESHWVRNVRAAEGHAAIRRRRRHDVRLREVDREQRPAVIRAYLDAAHARSSERSAARQAKFYFGLEARPSFDEIQEIAGYYPVFRIEYEPATTR
jgi:deazaflavin-dependent oxidoreductase (nitroreductase family)